MINAIEIIKSKDYKLLFDELEHLAKRTYSIVSSQSENKTLFVFFNLKSV